MTKTFKLSVIFFLTTLWLVAVRILFGFINLSDNISNWLFSFLVQVIGMGVIPLTLYKFWVKDDIKTGLYITRNKLSLKIFLLVLLVAILFRYLTIGVSVIWQSIIGLIGYTSINSVGTIYSGVEVLILDILCTAMLPAIFEEITNRGVTMRLFEDVKEDNTKIILMALLFSLAHQNITQTGYTFVGGLVIAYVAVKTKSILPGMIIHFVNNFFSVISNYSSQTSGAYSVLENKLFDFINNNFFLAIISWIIVAILIISILRYIRDIMKKREPEQVVSAEAENFYTYNQKGSNMQPLNDLFGFSTPKNAIKTRSKWYEYAFLYGSIALALATTIFTFIWGLLR
jgi:membrane protease YdiL (CAAX protease family)